MSALNDIVRKFKQAVTGVEETQTSEAKPFNWEPLPMAPLPDQPEEKPAKGEATAPAPSVPMTWKRQQSELPSVVGGGIPADVSDFATVYKGAGLQPPNHGYGVDRVAGMLQHKSLSGLDKSVKASAVLAALDAAGVNVRDVVYDGLLRYKALIAFEAAKELELHQIRPRNEHRIEDLQAASEAFEREKRAEIEALTRETTAAVAALARLKSRQRAEEDRFHRAISMFVEPLPARIIPMPTKPPEAPPSGTGPLDSRPELKLVTPPVPTPAAPSQPAPPAEADTTLVDEPVPETVAAAPAAATPEAAKPAADAAPEPGSPPAEAPAEAQPKQEDKS